MDNEYFKQTPRRVITFIERKEENAGSAFDCRKLELSRGLVSLHQPFRAYIQPEVPASIRIGEPFKVDAIHAITSLDNRVSTARSRVWKGFSQGSRRIAAGHRDEGCKAHKRAKPHLGSGCFIIAIKEILRL